MHPSSVAVDPDVLRRWYVEERLTIAEIATRLRCGASTIRRRLHGLAIPRRRHGPEPGRWRGGVRSPAEPIAWSSDVAYAVGIIATDGNLSPRAGRLTVVSKDVQLLDTVKGCLGLTAPSRPHASGFGGGACFRVDWNHRRFYDWLLSIGLTPAKSLTLGPLRIPDHYFIDFFRGCIDGDGSIVTYTDRYNTRKRPEYVYTRLYVSITSASPRFVGWLQHTTRRLYAFEGYIGVKRSTGRRDMWCLKYAKAESLGLLRAMYYDAAVPCLARKRDIAEPFLVPPTALRARRTGRPMVL